MKTIYIYKITNNLNGRIYIGKTTRSIQDRWKRHINDATSERLDTHLSRAIRKYGAENFCVEEVDKALDRSELSEKEIFWIGFYQSNINGYNMTAGGDGNNTYASKSNDELQSIKSKIRDSKLGIKNPHARSCKCRNVISGEEIHFGTAKECMEYFGESNHNFITRRCLHKVDYLFRGEWQISYENEDYARYYTTYKRSRKGHNVRIINIETAEIRDFPCYAEAERFLGVPRKYLSSAAYKHGTNPWIKDNKYIIRAIG